MLFRDRREAGQILAHKLAAYAGRSNVLVLAVPRGGVPVAFEVARALGAPLELFSTTNCRIEVPTARCPEEETAPAPVAALPTVLLVDDGLTSELVLRLAVTSLRQQPIGRLLLVLPVTTPEAHVELLKLADEVVCAHTPEGARAVGQWYQDFSPTTAAEVRELVQRLARGPVVKPSQSAT